jgi:hypothetical protein
MRNRVSRSLQPVLEGTENRCLATVHPLMVHLGIHPLVAHVNRLPHSPPRWAAHPGPLGSSQPVIRMFGGGGSQGTLPSNYQDWGVISIWNSTNHRVTFSASASTYQDGRYFTFTLRPGGHQTYYAAFDQFGNAPAFHVSFDPIHRSNPTLIADINTVFEKLNWFPKTGTEGRPYAIATDVSGRFLTPI